MEYVALGKTNIMVSRAAFGSAAINGIESVEEAVSVIRAAYEGGINYFDASSSLDSAEIKLGYAFYGMRKDVFIATKTKATSGIELQCSLAKSLENLQTDYIDVYMLDNPEKLPSPDDDGLYAALFSAKADGIIRHIGISTTSPEIALEAAESGFAEIIQFPFNICSCDDTEKIVNLCSQLDVGFVADKALKCGDFANIPLAFGYLRKFENVVPLWNFKTLDDVKHLMYFVENPPVVDERFESEVAAAKIRFQNS